MYKGFDYHHLSVFFRSELGVSICDADGELLCSLDNVLSDSGGNRVGNGGSVSTVVHHKHFQFGNIVDNNALESVGADVSGGLVGTVSDARHRDGSLESTADTSINTLGLAPRGVADANKLIGLMPGELLCSLLDNSLLIEGDWSGHFDSRERWVPRGR